MSQHTVHTSTDLKQHLQQHAADIAPMLIDLRRDIHAHPELGLEEHRTAAKVAETLTTLGWSCRTGVGGTGVVADLVGQTPGPTVLLRADMDALPIHEQTRLPYASTVPGKMHACGHDIHTAMLIGVAALLKTIPELPGRVRLMFQPAEETLQGAQAMITDGVLDGVDMAFGFHNRPDMAAGHFGLIQGASSASCDRFTINLHGRGGHGARPNLALSPIAAGAWLINQINTITSLSTDALQACSIGIGAFQSGQAHNVIPEHGKILGTVRSQHPVARQVAYEQMQRICQGVEQATGVRCELQYEFGAPASINDDRLLAFIRQVLQQQFGDVTSEVGSGMGSEDFAFVAERVPSFRLLIGSAQDGRNDRVHTPTYQPDERCIAIGAQALTRIALEALTQNPITENPQAESTK